jgi:hypothetical protein
MSWSARLVALVAAMAALATASSAFGEANVHFNAKIRPASHGTKMEYYGRVRSNVEACQAGRTVRISSGLLIAQTGTGEDGKFSVVASSVPDGSTVKFKLTRNGRECPAQTITVEL